MYELTKELHFCYGHRLMEYNGPCVHPHGHNARVVVTLESEELNRDDMVHDFTDLKQVLKPWIESHLDHKMLLRSDDPLVALLKELGEPVYEMDCNPTAEAIAAEIFRYARRQGLPVTEVTVWETERAAASYREPLDRRGRDKGSAQQVSPLRAVGVETVRTPQKS